MISQQTLKGNLVLQDYTTAFTLNQGDKGVPFKIELLENGTSYTLLSTDTVSIEWLKPNGKPFLQDGDIIYGTNYIEIITPEAVAQYSGSGTFNIIISDGTVRKGTIRREYKVVATSMTPGSVSEDVITDAMTELRNLNSTLAATIQTGNLDNYAKKTYVNKEVELINSSLEEKANRIDVVRKGYGTLSDFDESTRATLLGLQEGQINAVLGERNVLSENIGLNVINNEHISSEIMDGVLTKKFTTSQSGSYENASALLYKFNISSTIINNIKVKFKSVSMSDNNYNIKIKVALNGPDSNLVVGSVKDFSGIVEMFESIDYSSIEATELYVYIWVEAKDITKQSSYCVYDLEVKINDETITNQYTLSPYNIGSAEYTISDYILEPKLFSYKKGIELEEKITSLNKQIINEVTENIQIDAKINSLNLIQLELIFDVSGKDSFDLCFTIKDNSNIIAIGSRLFLNEDSDISSVGGTQIYPDSVSGITEYSRTINGNTSSYAHVFLDFTVSDTSVSQNIVITDCYIKIDDVITKYNKVVGLYNKNDTDTFQVIEINSSNLVTHEQLDKITEDIKSRLYGKKIIAIGDSMVQGHTIAKDKGWLAMIANRNNMTYVNYGINGTYMTNKLYNSNKGVVERYVDMDDDADYIIVFAGTNDGNAGVTIGENSSTDPSEFKGALNVICDGLLTKYPTGKIMFITPYLRNENYRNYVQAIHDICEDKYSIRVYDNMKNGGICWQNTAQVNALTLGDTYHLNLVGMEYASYKYEEELKRL